MGEARCPEPGRDRCFRRAAALAILAVVCAAGASAAQTPLPRTASPELTSTRQVLLLPSLRSAGSAELSPWATPSARARFDSLESALSAAFAEVGYGVIETAKALEAPATRALLAGAEEPLTGAEAAEIARSAGAGVALVVRAEALRGRAGGGSPFHTTDALVEATAYRAKDGLPLKRISTRVTGTGRGEAEADARALAHAASPIVAALAAPLAAAGDRPVTAARALPMTLEGSLNWREYQRVLDVIREEIPELESIEERRFSRGRFTLQGRCRCEAAEAAGRLDGLLRGGFRLGARAEADGLAIRVEPAGAARAPAPEPLVP